MRRALIIGADGMCFVLPALYLAYVKQKSEFSVRNAIKNGWKFCGYKIDWMEAA